jgi:hypothetical protein
MVFTAWALYWIVIKHTGSPVFVHVCTRPLDWVLAGAIATSSHLSVECDTPITSEHGRRSCDDLATCGGGIVVANRSFTHLRQSIYNFSINNKFDRSPLKLLRTALHISTFS